VSLAASTAKTTYTKDERVVITLALKNESASDVGISEMIDGTVSITSLMRDGVVLGPRGTVTTYEDDLGLHLQRGVMQIKGGGSIALTWMSDSDSVSGGQSLRTVQYVSGDMCPTQVYAIERPGTYDLSVIYQYPAAADASGNVFLDKTNPATVRFDISS
jgi:hypothetical protein